MSSRVDLEVWDQLGSASHGDTLALKTRRRAWPSPRHVCSCVSGYVCVCVCYIPLQERDSNHLRSGGRRNATFALMCSGPSEAAAKWTKCEPALGFPFGSENLSVLSEVKDAPFPFLTLAKTSLRSDGGVDTHFRWRRCVGGLWEIRD